MSHNEQLQMINHYKQMNEEKTKFSLEVVNKSMFAVDLIRKYKGKDASSHQRHSSKNDLDDIEAKIIQCQASIQKDLIPMDPTSMVKSPLSLQYLKSGSQQVQTNSHLPKLYPYPFQHESHNYENQASNILEMEKRYETPLKQNPNIRNVVIAGVGNALDGQSGLLP
jgi:hypothetical protein